MKKLLNITFFLSVIIILLLGFALPVNPPVGNWYQQFMPSIGSQQISGITFLDSLTGFAITQSAPVNDTAFILKTTNSGDSWSIIFSAADDFTSVEFINSNTGFVSGGEIYKTTNAGANWTILAGTPNPTKIEDMDVLSNDTIWFVDDVGLGGGVFFTSNGGASWTRQLNLGSLNPYHIYMYNGRIGFIAEDNNYLRRTTNSGLNWDVISGAVGFTDMYFIDSLNGWKNNELVTIMQKTTDGGLNWVTQTMPFGGNIFASPIFEFSNINKDTILGVGGIMQYGNNFKGMLYRTTNGGTSWLFQIPDTNIQIAQYNYVEFINKHIGWAYRNSPTGVHTTIGGDPVWYTGIQQISNNLPKDFELHQNYPNPFNPRTVIPFSLKKAAYVRLIAYDITGREIQKMVEGNYSAGEYEVDFMGKFTASGVYLYRMEAEEQGGNKFVETKKMILLK